MNLNTCLSRLFDISGTYSLYYVPGYMRYGETRLFSQRHINGFYSSLVQSLGIFYVSESPDFVVLHDQLQPFQSFKPNQTQVWVSFMTKIRNRRYLLLYSGGLRPDCWLFWQLLCVGKTCLIWLSTRETASPNPFGLSNRTKPRLSVKNKRYLWDPTVYVKNTLFSILCEML